MTQKRVLTTVSVTQDNLLPVLNREVIPVLRQIIKATPITVSRATMSPFELALLPILVNAGIATDKTTP